MEDNPLIADEVVERKAPSEIAAYNPIKLALAELRKRHEGVVYDLTKPDQETAARKARRELVSMRTRLEETRQAEKKFFLEAGRQVDAQAKAITAEIAALEDPLDRDIRALEAKREEEKVARARAEKARTDAHEARIRDIRAILDRCRGLSSAEIAERVTALTAWRADGFEEYQLQAEQATAETLAALRKLHDDTVAREQEAAREAERRAELERREAELRRQQEELAAERARQEEAAAAERAREAKRQRERGVVSFALASIVGCPSAAIERVLSNLEAHQLEDEEAQRLQAEAVVTIRTALERQRQAEADAAEHQRRIDREMELTGIRLRWRQTLETARSVGTNAAWVGQALEGLERATYPTELEAEHASALGWLREIHAEKLRQEHAVLAEQEAQRLAEAARERRAQAADELYAALEYILADGSTRMSVAARQRAVAALQAAGMQPA